MTFLSEGKKGRGGRPVELGRFPTKEGGDSSQADQEDRGGNRRSQLGGGSGVEGMGTAGQWLTWESLSEGVVRFDCHHPWMM